MKRMMEKIKKRKIFWEFRKTVKTKPSEELYGQIVDLYSKLFIEDLMEGKHIRTPIGSFWFTKRLTKKPVVDWVKTNETGYMIYHFNEHSKNYKLYLYWTGLYNKEKNRCPYKIYPVRQVKQYIGKRIRKEPTLIDIYELHKY
jgi:hypothetical protein